MSDEADAKPKSWDEAARIIAKRVMAGDVVEVGKYLLVERVGSYYTATCKQCEATQKILMSANELTARLTELAEFMAKHSHNQVN